MAESFDYAVAHFNWSLKNRTLAKYLELRARRPGAAARFLSSCFKRNKGFEVALTSSDAGQLLETQKALLVVEVQRP